jgi:hypothetical protein
VSRAEAIRAAERAVEHTTDARFQRQVERLHDLGPRAVGELLREVANGADLGLCLTRYARLDPAVVKALGGDQFPPLPIYEVRHG